MELFSENGNFLVGKVATDGDTVTVQGARVRADQCDEVMVCVHLGVGDAADATCVATVTVEEHTANTSGSTATKTFDQVLLTSGATALTAGATKGRPTRTKYTTAQSTYATLAADGLKEQLVQIPIRTRALSKGYAWLSAKVTGLTGTRLVAIYYIRSGESYGADQTIDLY